MGPALQIGGMAPLECYHNMSFWSGADKEMLKCAAPETSRCCWRLFEHVRSNGTLGEQLWEAVIAGLHCWLESFIAERSSCREFKQRALGSLGWELPQIKKLPQETQQQLWVWSYGNFRVIHPAPSSWKLAMVETQSYIYKEKKRMTDKIDKICLRFLKNKFPQILTQHSLADVI